MVSIDELSLSAQILRLFDDFMDWEYPNEAQGLEGYCWRKTNMVQG